MRTSGTASRSDRRRPVEACPSHVAPSPRPSGRSRRSSPPPPTSMLRLAVEIFARRRRLLGLLLLRPCRASSVSTSVSRRRRVNSILRRPADALHLAPPRDQHVQEGEERRIVTSSAPTSAIGKRKRRSSPPSAPSPLGAGGAMATSLIPPAFTSSITWPTTPGLRGLVGDDHDGVVGALDVQALDRSAAPRAGRPAWRSIQISPFGADRDQDVARSRVLGRLGLGPGPR